MNVQEFDTSLSDLETRVDRLRALYENWFRGYEKAEPTVARKEVERRVYALRKELPRNTALRFRYHQLYQRYTTLASYWQRTARQIEEGTYRLQLQRMRRRNDEVARTMAPRAPSDSEPAQPTAYELDGDVSLDINSLLDEAALDGIGNALEARPTLPPPKSAPAPAPAPSPARAIGRFARPSLTRSEPPVRPSLKLEGRDDIGGGSSRMSLPEDERHSGYPTLPPSARIPAANTGAIPGMPSPKLPPIASLRPSLTPMAQPRQGSAGPGAKSLAPATSTSTLPGLSGKGSSPVGASMPPLGRPSLSPGTGTSALPPLGRPSLSPGTGTSRMPPFGRPSLTPAASTPSTSPLSLPPAAKLPFAAKPAGTLSARPPFSSSTGTLGLPSAAKPGALGAPSAAKSSQPKPSVPPLASGRLPLAPIHGTPAGTPAGLGAKPEVPPLGARPGLSPTGGLPASGASAVRPPPPPPPGRPSLPSVPRPPVAPAGAASAQRASLPAGAPAPRPPLPPRNPTLTAPPSARVGNTAEPARTAPDAVLGEQRMRRLYDEYAAARRQNNEADVRFETLQSSIQKMLPDLRKKHEGKQIDFEVVLKDGRVGLKPKPK